MKRMCSWDLCSFHKYEIDNIYILIYESGFKFHIRTRASDTIKEDGIWFCYKTNFGKGGYIRYNFQIFKFLKKWSRDCKGFVPSKYIKWSVL